MKPVVVHRGINSTDFIKRLRGVLGDELKLQESQLYCSILQNHPGRTFRKKRSARFDASLLDGPSISDVNDEEEVADGPSTSDVNNEEELAVTHQVLRGDSFNPQFSCKEEHLVSSFPHNFSRELSRGKEEAINKARGEPKIRPENQRNRSRGEDFIEGKMRAVKKVTTKPVLQNPTPELPMNFKIQIRELTGSTEVEALFVYEKTLFRTDVNPGQNRFLIPLKQVKNNFLTEKEKEILKTGDEISGKGSIEALLIEPSLDKCKINLRKWDMGGKSSGKVSENYVLVTTWNKVVQDNNLAEGMTVQLWSFRRGDELCFALVNRG